VRWGVDARDRDSIFQGGSKSLFFSKGSRPSLVSTQSPIQYVPLFFLGDKSAGA